MERLANYIKLLEKPGRQYKYEVSCDESIEKQYKYIEGSRKKFAYAQDECGGIFDCFILYAIAMLGIADRTSIRLFLKNLKKCNPNLYIADMDNTEGLRSRLRALQKYGYVFATSIAYQHQERNGEIENRATYYTIDKDANEMMNRTLSKRVPYNKFLENMPVCRILGWASVSYAGSCICNHSNFCAYLDGAFRSKLLGKFYFPSEIKFFDGIDLHYVGMLDAYLLQDKRTQSDVDFAEWQASKINAIKNYLAVRTSKGITEFVICVQDAEDLNKIGKLILRTRILIEYLPYIYFTGEGILKSVEHMEEAFLQMVFTGDGLQEEPVFRFVPPAFLMKRRP